jgi:hypothetical protein
MTDVTGIRGRVIAMSEGDYVIPKTSQGKDNDSVGLYAGGRLKDGRSLLTDGVPLFAFNWSANVNLLKSKGMALDPMATFRSAAMVPQSGFDTTTGKPLPDRARLADVKVALVFYVPEEEVPNAAVAAINADLEAAK